MRHAVRAKVLPPCDKRLHNRHLARDPVFVRYKNIEIHLKRIILAFERAACVNNDRLAQFNFQNDYLRFT